MVQIYNYHDAKMAAIGGFNCNGNKSTLNAMSTYSGSSSIGDYPLWCMTGFGPQWNFKAYHATGGALSFNDMVAIGPKSYYAADTTQSFNNYSKGTDWGTLFDGGAKSVTMGFFEGLTAKASDPNLSCNILGAGLNGLGSIFDNAGKAIS